MNHKEFTNIFFEKKQITHEMKRIQSKSHQIRTCSIKQNFPAMFDDKRHILDHRVKTLAYGHKDVETWFN